jgi:hypothetical protein
VNVTAEREEAQRFPYLVAHKTLKRIELHERQRVRVTGHERAKSQSKVGIQRMSDHPKTGKQNGGSSTFKAMKFNP